MCRERVKSWMWRRSWFATALLSSSPASMGHSGQVLAMAFVAAPFNVLVTSGEKDRMLRCWDMILKPKLDAVVGPAGKRQAKACEPQVMLKWLRSLRSGGVDPPRSSGGGGGSGGDSKGNGAADVSAILVSGGAGGTVNIWQLTAKHLEILNTLPGHTGAVTSACVLPHPEVFVTGSLDADIRVWATKTYKFKRVMKGHSRGVVTIDYSPTQRVIVSAGFDHDILVWSPVAGQVICRLSGHGCSLVAARVSAVSSDVISVSMDGIIKVWDSANFKCVQTIHSHRQQEKRPGAPSSSAGRGGKGAGHGGGGGKMQWGKASQDGGEAKTKSKASLAPGGCGVVDLFLFEGETSRLLVCRGTELDFHDNGRAGEKDVTDSNQTIDVMYHSETGTFASVASTGIKLWDARTGRLTRVYGVPPRPATFSSGGRWAKRRRAGLGAAGGVGFSRVVDVNGDCGDAEGTGRFRGVEAGEAEEITSACIDSRGHQIVMGFNTGRVACARYLTGRLVGQLDFHPGEIMVLDPALEAIRMERSNQIVEGTVVNVASAVKQLMVGAKILRAKKTFLTTLESFRGRNWRSDSNRGGTAGEATAWSGAPTITTVTDTNSSTSTLLTREGGGTGMPSGVSSNMGGQPPGGGGQGEGGRATLRGKSDSNMFIDNDNSTSASGNDRTSERQIVARSGKGNHGNNAKSVRIAGVGGVIAEGADFTDEDREVAQQAGGGKVEELRSPRAVAEAPTGAAATVGGMTPTPPVGQKPRPSSSSLFNKKFAKRFLRSGGGGGGSSSSRSDRLRQRDGEDQESPLRRRRRHVQGGTGGEGQGHDGGGANNKGGGYAGGKKIDGRGGGGRKGGKDAQVNIGSRFRSHITTVAVSHMYQLAATGSLNGNVIVWDVQRGPSTCGLATLEAHNGYQVNSICFLEPHAALVTCNLEGTIAVWRMGPAPDPLKDYRGLGEESGEQGFGDDDDRRINATTTAAARAAAGGGDPVVATIRAGSKGRRRATGERMAPSSEWRCVALFFNNNTSPSNAAPAFPGEGLGVGGCSQGQEAPVPAAVNSLAWSSLEERLFTGDTVGFVKVWDIKGALTSSGTEDESRQVAKTSKDGISKMVHNDSSSITIDSSTISGEDKEKEKERKENDDNQQNNTANNNYNDTITTSTTTTTTDNPDNVNNNNDVDINAMVAMKHEEEENEGPETPSHRGSAQLTACIPPPSMAPLDANLRDDFSSLGLADGDATSSDEDDGIGMNGGSKAAGTSSSAHGEHSLWSSESSESISGQDYGDRFGRGVGLRFVRRLDEWRPGKEGRQEVIKVKVFEGQGVSFRGVAIVGRDRPRPGADNHGRYRGNRRRPMTKSGTVIVVTITPDKLVRFWTSGGDLLGSLDQLSFSPPTIFLDRSASRT
ncbi:WD40 domain containing protein [Ectocarpus siliculosus]|uniref:WD40 domain containing protein n=1 Tax=Ectocarpus siliculosus TaxID=2880 RepID=D7G633_ECTSI|nr:WD40 domain containing protein [Ectocarpus siliculosus]|eukprot:CBJ27442.1 WD40 domain containing protein [Ectocarpus siliculosus]